MAPDLLDQTMISHGSTDVDLIYIYIKVRSDMNHNMNLGRSLTLLLVLNSAILETYPGSSFEQPVTYPTKLQYHMVQPMLI